MGKWGEITQLMRVISLQLQLVGWGPSQGQQLRSPEMRYGLARFFGMAGFEGKLWWALEDVSFWANYNISTQPRFPWNKGSFPVP